MDLAVLFVGFVMGVIVSLFSFGPLKETKAQRAARKANEDKTVTPRRNPND